MSDAATAVRPRTRGAAPPPAPPPEALPELPDEFATLCKSIDKVHGSGVIETADKRRTWRHIPTDIFALDFALGGGIPEGLATMIYGWQSGGKSTILLRLIASAQRKYPNMWAVLVDTEGTFDPIWATVHGVDLARLKIVQPASGEQACDIIAAAIQARNVSLVALDSVPMLVPMNEQVDKKGNDRSFEDVTVGSQANLITRFLRVVNKRMIDERVRDHWPTLVLINQWRTKIGVMHGDPRTLPGGNALNYVASVKIEMKNKENVDKDGRGLEIVTHNDHSFTIHKNKVFNGARTGEFQMVRDPAHPFGAGYIDENMTVVGIGRQLGKITGSGSSWRMDGIDERFNSLKSMGEALDANPVFAAEFKRELIGIQRAAMGKPATGWL